MIGSIQGSTIVANCWMPVKKTCRCTTRPERRHFLSSKPQHQHDLGVGGAAPHPPPCNVILGKCQQLRPCKFTSERPGDKAAVDLTADLYSRQLLLIGRDGQEKLSKASVLLCGLSGVGVEVAKNLILSGVGRVVLCDPIKVQLEDLSSNFFLKVNDVGRKSRARACLQRLQALNPNVQVRLNDDACGDLAMAIHRFNVVVLVNAPLALQVHASSLLRTALVRPGSETPLLVCAEARGVFGSVFNDFGSTFEVTVRSEEASKPIRLTGFTPGYPTEFQTGATQAKGDIDQELSAADRHGLYPGDLVVIRTSSDHPKTAMAAGASDDLLRVVAVSSTTFSVDVDSSTWTALPSGAHVRKVELPLTMSFQPLSTALKRPQILHANFCKDGCARTTHACFRALDKFRLVLGRLPKPGRDSGDLTKFLSLLHEFDADPNMEVAQAFCCSCAGQLAPIATIIGGIAAQEVMKGITRVFVPIQQFLYVDALDCLSRPLPSAADCRPRRCRYDGQIAALGWPLQAALSQLNLFIVGAGAIGSELLKLSSLVGVASRLPGSRSRLRLLKWLLVRFAILVRYGLSFFTCKQAARCGVAPVEPPRGQQCRVGSVRITDMDRIERSNLSRQFLYRENDVHKLKSVTAVARVQEMNPDLCGAVPYVLEIGPESTAVFDDKFWQEVCIVCNALDNLEARLFVDQQCLFYGKPLVDCGTAGAKGSVQAIVPHVSESYSSSSDAEDERIPLCTVRNFPVRIEHAVQWATNQFQRYFHDDVIWVRRFLTSPVDTVKALSSVDLESGLEILRTITNGVADSSDSRGFANCVSWAHDLFHELFYHGVVSSEAILDEEFQVKCRTYGFPKGVWLDAANLDEHLDFIRAAVNLRASVVGVTQKPLTRDGLRRAIVNRLHLPSSRAPKGGFMGTEEARQHLKTLSSKHNNTSRNSAAVVRQTQKVIYELGCGYLQRIDHTCSIEKKDKGALRYRLIDAVEKLEQVSEKAIRLRWHPHPPNYTSPHLLGGGSSFEATMPSTIKFEKDEETSTSRMDFIATSSNLRAQNFNIPMEGRDRIEQIAGNIISALATTTSVVSGFGFLEIYKMLNAGIPKQLDNHQYNAANNILTYSRGIKTSDYYYYDYSFSSSSSSYGGGERMRIAMSRPKDVELPIVLLPVSWYSGSSQMSNNLLKSTLSKGHSSEMSHGVTSTRTASRCEPKSQTLERFRNTFINLAVPFFACSRPSVAPVSYFRGGVLSGLPYTPWDLLDIDEGRDLTIWELVDHLQTQLSIKVEMITCGEYVVYSCLVETDNDAEHGKQSQMVNKTVRQCLTESFTKDSQSFPRGRQKYACMFVFGQDSKTGKELEMPPLRYRFGFKPN